MSDSFVHLHLHNEFPLLDGMIRIKDLAKRAKELGMPAVEMTDHGNLYGAIKFWLEPAMPSKVRHFSHAQTGRPTSPSAERLPRRGPGRSKLRGGGSLRHPRRNKRSWKF
jgi:hypothetical protein